jgi:hypothetical protein
VVFPCWTLSFCAVACPLKLEGKMEITTPNYNCKTRWNLEITRNDDGTLEITRNNEGTLAEFTRKNYNYAYENLDIKILQEILQYRRAVDTGGVHLSRAASEPEELRDSELSHGCRRDTVTVCFQYPAPEVTIMVT